MEPLIPPAKRGGRKREVEVREVMNGVMYVLSTGCQWRYIPKDLPPRSTVHDYLTRWNHDGTIEEIHHLPISKLPRPNCCSPSCKQRRNGNVEDGPGLAAWRTRRQAFRASCSGLPARSTGSCAGPCHRRSPLRAVPYRL